jgi:hypothetical protein
MRRRSQLAVIAVFLAFIFSQAAAFALCSRAGSFENRRLAQFPELRWDGFSDNQTTDALSAYVRDRMPLRPALITVYNWMVFTLFRDSPVDQVRIGRDGWLFLSRTIESSPCSPEADPERLIPKYDGFVEAARAVGKLPLIVLSPDKATMYPEFLSDRDRGRFESCAAPRRARLERRFESQNARYFVNLWEILREEKRRLLAKKAETWQERRLRYLYRPRDRHWHLETGRLQARAIVDRIAPHQEARTPWPEISTMYLLQPCEMSKRFLKFDLPEPYARPVTVPPGLSESEIEVPGSGQPIKQYTYSDSGADARQVVVIHDSFIWTSEKFLAVNFSRVDFIYWGIVKERFDAIRSRILEADVVVLQMVESDQGTWSNQVARITNLLRRAHRRADRRGVPVSSLAR